MSVAHAYGKYQWNVNVQEIVNGCDILVATTGRLMSLIRDRIVHAHTIKMFVLDDADQLLEPEFVKDLRDLEHSPGFPKVPFYLFFLLIAWRFTIGNKIGKFKKKIFFEKNFS